MQQVRAKYPIKIGDALIPNGTVGELVSVATVRVRFPDIKPDENSPFVAVQFPGMEWCIIPKKQLEAVNPGLTQQPPTPTAPTTQ